MPLINTAICKECEQKYDRIRLDQKFCTRKCRNDFNNRIDRNKKTPTRFIDNILHNNRKIIHELGTNVITIEELRDIGFDFNYITHIRRNKQKTYYGCYEYLYAYEGKNVKIYFDKQTKNN